MVVHTHRRCGRMEWIFLHVVDVQFINPRGDIAVIIIRVYEVILMNNLKYHYPMDYDPVIRHREV